MVLFHGLAGIDRTRYWKLLLGAPAYTAHDDVIIVRCTPLGVESRSHAARAFVQDQLVEQYDDLRRAVMLLWPALAT